MKKEELTKLGLTDEQADSVLVMAGKDVEKHKKTITDLEAERDDLKTRLTTAEKTVEGFGGKSPEDIQKEIDKYKQESADANKRFEAQILARDQRDWLKGQYDTYGVTSPYARNALTAEAQAEKSGLVWKDGAYVGFDDFMKKAKEKDGSIYQTAEEKAAAGKQEPPKTKQEPAIVGPSGAKPGAAKKYTPPVIF